MGAFSRLLAIPEIIKIKKNATGRALKKDLVNTFIFLVSHEDSSETSLPYLHCYGQYEAVYYHYDVQIKQSWQKEQFLSGCTPWGQMPAYFCGSIQRNFCTRYTILIFAAFVVSSIVYVSYSQRYPGEVSSLHLAAHFDKEVIVHELLTRRMTRRKTTIAMVVFCNLLLLAP